jgi:L-malate glycosyltransferase
MKMKICFLGNSTSIHMLKWARWFAKEHEVHLITDFKADIPNVKVHFVGGWHGDIDLLWKALRTSKIIRELNPDVVHAHYISTYGVMGALCNHYPFIVSSWGSDITKESYRLYKKYPLNFALGKADFISAYDKVLVDRLAELGFHDIVRKRIVGIDTDMFNKSHSADRLPGLENIPGHLLICTRPLNARGGVDTIIKALPKVVRQFPDTKLYLVYLVENQEQVLKEMADSLGVRDNVIFAGRAEHEIMPSLLATSDIFIDTYSSKNRGSDEIDRYPGLGAAAMESMASSTPVVIPAAEETVDSDRPYVTYVHRDPESLADAIIRLCDERTHTMMANKGLDYVREVASNEKIMHDWENFYSSLLKK